VGIAAAPPPSASTPSNPRSSRKTPAPVPSAGRFITGEQGFRTPPPARPGGDLRLLAGIAATIRRPGGGPAGLSDRLKPHRARSAAGIRLQGFPGRQPVPRDGRTTTDGRSPGAQR
ncbi:MAG: hypothetical protein ACK53Y_05380, partial [bacterium]